MRGSASQRPKPAKVSKVSSPDSTTREPASCPLATTMGLRRLGLLEKSQPISIGSGGTALATGSMPYPSAKAVTPAAISTAPAMRAARSPSPSRWPPMSAANSIDTSRAGATCDSGASCMAYSTST